MKANSNGSGAAIKRVPRTPAKPRFTPRHLGKGSAQGAGALRCAVHPQASGERVVAAVGGAPVAGSPPGIWGKGGKNARCRLHERFTPRHLGKGRAHQRAAGSGTVHPQASGERSSSSSPRPRQSGSPPGIWGKVSPDLLLLTVLRFTPRHLGKGAFPARTGAFSPVHPQASGERPVGVQKDSTDSGSPPGIWGKDHHGGDAATVDRFTPRHLGKGRARVDTYPATAVHPQASGEREVRSLASGGKRGSPPGIWGKGCLAGRQCLRCRFTPRHLGKGHHCRRERRRCPVHPQASGERRPATSAGRPDGGSPPGIWGKGQQIFLQLAPVRFTPRHLGKGSRPVGSKRSGSVHPQASGERVWWSAEGAVPPGSPPGIWGKGYFDHGRG